MSLRYARKIVDGIEEQEVTQFADLVAGNLFFLYESDDSLAHPHPLRANSDAYTNEDGIPEIETLPAKPVVVKAQ